MSIAELILPPVARQALATPQSLEVSRYDMAYLTGPGVSGRYHPVDHHNLYDAVHSQLDKAGYPIAGERWTVSNYGNRVFGVVDLNLPVSRSVPGGGVSVALGVRSSYDKSLALGIVAGSRVMVCSNLAFSGEISYKRKHTLYGHRDFTAQIMSAVSRVQVYREVEAARFERWANHSLTDDQARSFVFELFGRGVIPHRLFSTVYKELNESRFDDFAGGFTVWTLFNRLTTCLRERATTRAADHAIETQAVIRSIESSLVKGV